MNAPRWRKVAWLWGKRAMDHATEERLEVILLLVTACVFGTTGGIGSSRTRWMRAPREHLDRVLDWYIADPEARHANLVSDLRQTPHIRRATAHMDQLLFLLDRDPAFRKAHWRYVGIEILVGYGSFRGLEEAEFGRAAPLLAVGAVLRAHPSLGALALSDDIIDFGLEERLVGPAWNSDTIQAGIARSHQLLRKVIAATEVSNLNLGWLDAAQFLDRRLSTADFEKMRQHLRQYMPAIGPDMEELDVLMVIRKGPLAQRVADDWAPPSSAPLLGSEPILDFEGLPRQPSDLNTEGIFAARPAPERWPDSDHPRMLEKIAGLLRLRPTKEPAVDRVDAAAFAPKALRRGTPEQITVTLFPHGQFGRVRRETRRRDVNARVSGKAPLGLVARGAALSIEISTTGVDCKPAVREIAWTGKSELVHFLVTPTADPAIEQAYFSIRVGYGDAQIGSIDFVRAIRRTKATSAPSHSTTVRLRRFKRVFISYSSRNRELVEPIANTYDGLGVQCFFDRRALLSGEEWSPRLFSEIDQTDLFHLCWSQDAAASEWVEKETLHAMSRRRANRGRRPDIKIQMLDGPPWAPHPASLNALNFDDYGRAAMMGYAMGQRLSSILSAQTGKQNSDT